jgi:hypothetical protein
MRIRPLTGWANAAMLGVAAGALSALLVAFLPLVEVWAVHRVAHTGGAVPYTVTLLAVAGVGAAFVLAHLFAGVALLVWSYRGYANLRAAPRRRFLPGFAVLAWFVPPLAPVVLGGLTGHRGTRRLAWAWWAVTVLALAALVAGAAWGYSPELRDIDRQLAAGDTVDLGLAGSALGRLVGATLPAAALYVGAAVLLLVVIHRITVLHHDRFGVRGATIGA